MTFPLENPFGRPAREESEPYSERQGELGSGWRKRRISKEALEERGLRFDREDLDRYFEKKSKFRGLMKNVEEGAAAELMFLEGCDDETVGSKEMPPHWFGELVYAYPSSDVDDVLRGSDVILMVPDEEDERKAYPLSVDLKTNPDDYAERLVTQTEFTLRKGEPDRIYWVDTTSEPGASSFDVPTEGRVDALPIAAYIPSDIVKEFRRNATSKERAAMILQMLGPSIRRQAELQLTAIVTLLARKGRPGSPREAIETVMDDPPPLPPGKQKLFEIASHALRRIWSIQEEMQDQVFGEELAPETVASFRAANTNSPAGGRRRG